MPIFSMHAKKPRHPLYQSLHCLVWVMQKCLSFFLLRFFCRLLHAVIVHKPIYDKLGPLLYFYDPLNDYKVFIHFLTAIITVSKFYSSLCRFCQYYIVTNVKSVPSSSVPVSHPIYFFVQCHKMYQEQKKKRIRCYIDQQVL